MKTILGIDFGSDNLTIYKKGEGVIFKEPSLLCVKKSNNNYIVQALGIDAKNTVIQDEHQIIFSPLAEGVVKSVEYASLLLKYALNKTFKSLIFKNFEVKIATPCGLEPHQTEKFVLVAKLAGITKVETFPSILCVRCQNPQPTLVIDIGTGKTDIAVLQNDKILSGVTLGLGGYNIDAMILHHLSQKHNVIFAEHSARKIKEEIGSLLANDKGTAEINGLDPDDNTIHHFSVSSASIFPQIEIIFAEIAKTAHAVLNTLDNDKKFEVMQNSAIVVGSSAKITGVEKYFRQKLNIKITIPDDAEDSIALGFKNIL